MTDTIYLVPDCSRQHFEIADALSARYPELAVTYRSAALMFSPEYDYLLSIETDSVGSRIERYKPKRKPLPLAEFRKRLRSWTALDDDLEPLDAPFVEIVFRPGNPFVREVSREENAA